MNTTSPQSAADADNVQPLADQRLTPAMQQYWDHKRQVGDALLLFRMGDFYELFHDDAVEGARLLGLTLTSRDAGKTPLAGIPHHALESYLARLVAAGRKVAISEQIEDAAQAKGVVQRAVVRIVTPGTLTDDGLLQQTQANLLAAVVIEGYNAGIATLELSTGQFEVQLCPAERVTDELVRIAPAEILLPEQAGAGRAQLEEDLRDRSAAAFTYRASADFTAHRAESILHEQFETRSLEGFGFREMDVSLRAAGGLLVYARETQKTAIQHLRPPRRRDLSDYMTLDPTTLRSLEIERTLRTGARAGSLLAAVDRTTNAMGGRLLREWLCYPLRNAERIQSRQRVIEAFRLEDRARAEIRRALRDIGDIERMVGRLGVKRTTPRELRSLGDGLSRLRPLRESLRALKTEETDAFVAQLDGLDALADELCAALRDDAPHTLREGRIFAAGFNAELDRLRGIHSDGQQWLARYQATEAERTGIPNLKVGYNRVFGYYLEVTNANRARVPDNYQRKQTMKNAERFITDELKEFEAEALSAETKANELEYSLFSELRERVAGHIPQLQRAARGLSEIDVLAGWAELSLHRRYCRPEWTDAPLLEIDEGRHPVVEQALDHEFVPNETRLAGEQASLALITGPNMAGKSTYIRQVALLTLLAHCGCWTPARRMRLGLVDRIFTRVGASDELARGQSTFMVEMIETANILHNATSRSLVILDEIGRGTSTFDGLALAWAITEHLATHARCPALFATHYHELTELAELLPAVFNLNVAVKEYEDRIVFLHRIVAGAADRSYGLHVAKLAGVPRSVLERSNEVLSELERTFSRQSQRQVLAAVQRRRARQLRLFEEPEEIVVRELRNIDPGELPPDQAAQTLVRWRKLLAGGESDSPDESTT